MGLTSMQVTDEFKKRLKIAYVNQGLPSYEALLREMEDLYNTIIPFVSEAEFTVFFIKNIKLFGFSRVIERRKEFPDLIVEDVNGKSKRIEIELVAENFVLHGHDSTKVDYIVSAFAKDEFVKGVPVISILQFPKNIVRMLTKITLDVTDRQNLDFVSSLLDYRKKYPESKIDKSNFFRLIFHGISQKKFTFEDLVNWVEKKGVKFERTEEKKD